MTKDHDLRELQRQNELAVFIRYENALRAAYAKSKIRTMTLEDGCIRIQVGEYVGTVSSVHLVEVKINQLMSAWKSRHQAGGINQRSEI